MHDLNLGVACVFKIESAPQKAFCSIRSCFLQPNWRRKAHFRATHWPDIEITKIIEFYELKNALFKHIFEKVSSNAQLALYRELSELNAWKCITKKDREAIDRNYALLLQIVIENEALKHIIDQEKRFLRTATRLYIEKSSA